jgi:hypothetical protein
MPVQWLRWLHLGQTQGEQDLALLLRQLLHRPRPRMVRVSRLRLRPRFRCYLPPCCACLSFSHPRLLSVGTPRVLYFCCYTHAGNEGEVDIPVPMTVLHVINVATEDLLKDVPLPLKEAVTMSTDVLAGFGMASVHSTASVSRSLKQQSSVLSVTKAADKLAPKGGIVVSKREHVWVSSPSEDGQRQLQQSQESSDADVPSAPAATKPAPASKAMLCRRVQQQRLNPKSTTVSITGSKPGDAPTWFAYPTVPESRTSAQVCCTALHCNALLRLFSRSLVLVPIRHLVCGL